MMIYSIVFLILPILSILSINTPYKLLDYLWISKILVSTIIAIAYTHKKILFTHKIWKIYLAIIVVSDFIQNIYLNKNLNTIDTVSRFLLSIPIYFIIYKYSNLVKIKKN